MLGQETIELLARAGSPGQPFERIERDAERDFFMTEREAQFYGLVDEVVSQDAAARRNRDRHKRVAGKPAGWRIR